MTIRKIRIALETKLAALSGVWPTAYENSRFVPTTGTNWQRATLLPSPIQDFAGTTTTRKYTGLFLINVFTEANKGVKAAEDYALSLLEHFPKGLILTQDSVTVRIEGPYVGVANSDEKWYNIPVWVPWFTYF